MQQRQAIHLHPPHLYAPHHMHACWFCTPQVDPTQAATQADVVTASQNNAGGSAEAAGVNVEGGAAGGEGAGPSSQPSQPAAKLTPQQEQEQWEAAKAAAQTGGATNMNQLQHWYDMKLPTNSKAVLKVRLLCCSPASVLCTPVTATMHSAQGDAAIVVMLAPPC